MTRRATTNTSAGLTSVCFAERASKTALIFSNTLRHSLGRGRRSVRCSIQRWMMNLSVARPSQSCALLTIRKVIRSRDSHTSMLAVATAATMSLPFSKREPVIISWVAITTRSSAAHVM